MKMRLMQINIGVGSLPAVSNRIMEIRELRPSVCLSFGGRSVLNHLRLDLGLGRFERQEVASCRQAIF